MEEKYESLSLAALKELAKARGIRGVSAAKKSRLIEILRENDATGQPAREQERPAQEEMKVRQEQPAREETKVQQEQPAQEETKVRQELPVREETKVRQEQPAQEEAKVRQEQPAQGDSRTRMRSGSRLAEEGENRRMRTRPERPQARNTYESRPSRVQAAQEGRPVRSASPQEGRPMRGPAGQESRSMHVRAAQEYRPVRSATVQEGRPVRGASAQEGRPVRSASAQESRPVRSASAQESRPVRSASAQENRPVRGASAQESRPVRGASAQENRPVRSASAQEGRPARTPSVQENRPSRIRPVQETALSGEATGFEENLRVRPNPNPAPVEEAERLMSESRAAAPLSSLAETDRPPAELSGLDSGQTVSGILEVMQDGYGFIRSENYLPGENDVYVSPSQIRRFNLKTGDIICGNTRIKTQQEKFSALLYVKSISGMAPSEAMRRCNFEDMTPVFPNQRLRMERASRAIAMRIVDLFSPIGKGQRGMIVSPPKAGKTTLLKDVARSILQNDPEMRLIILLIDERPEEVTDIREAICGENVEVIYSTFDELPEHHKRVSEMVIERAKRLVEQKKDVTILLDSITRLARAYNLTVPPSGRTLSGGLDPAALHMPKRFFGAARNMREGGSLTVLATALIDTGSKMDDVVYEEFKGTGNMELVLDRKLSEKRLFPAIDIPKSGTRREDLLLDREEQEAVEIMRRALNGMKSDDAVENILNLFVHTRDNRELVQRVRRQKFV